MCVKSLSFKKFPPATILLIVVNSVLRYFEYILLPYYISNKHICFIGLYDPRENICPPFGM